MTLHILPAIIVIAVLIAALVFFATTYRWDRRKNIRDIERLFEDLR